MSIQGFWFAPESSTRHGASLAIIADGYQLSADDGESRTGLFSELTISDRLGDMPRRICWADGATFETRDNAAIDAWLAGSGHQASRSLVLHHLESRWGWVATALVLTVLVAYLGIRYGLPAASESIARKLPAPINESISEQALATLDRLLFDESAASAERQQEVQQQFDSLLAALPPSDINFKLHFREMNGLPNAMALPGGDIVVTDAFLDLVEHPQELESVLLHEIGHVVEYHGMTQVIRASAVSVIVALAFGDLSAMGEIAVGVPIFIMQNSYSQEAETEADAYAFARMREMGKDPRHFADIILRLTDQELIDDDTEQESGSYFSSHPDSRLRALNAREASRAMRLGTEQPTD